MIPEDLLVEILLRLPVKSLARCLCVSKLWLSIIRSRRFINLYQSTRQPRVMFAFRDICRYLCWHFFSSSQPHYLATNAVCHIDTSAFRNPDCVNGLICFEYMYRLWICNPAARKVILLPPPTTRKQFMRWFMGYDPINYQYKVLYLSKDYFSGPYTVEVFTLLGDQGSWKMIEGVNCQAPATRGICVDGFVCYGAYTAHGLRFVRFDVRTETFDYSIEIPAEACNIYGTYLGFYALVNYQGKLALLATKTIRKYDLWVLEDAEKQEWSRVSYVITREMCSLNIIRPGLVGFVPGSGELIVTAHDRYDQFHLVYVDLEKRRSAKVLLERIRCSYRSVPLIHAFTDYVESIMLL